MSRAGFSDDFKRNFATGIAALFPILVTLFLLSWLYRQLDSTIGERTNAVFREVLVRDQDVFGVVFPGAGAAQATLDKRRAYAREHFPAFVGVVFGLLLVGTAVYLTGRMLRVYIGRRAMDSVNRLFERFPVIKAIYPYARQVGELLFGQSGQRRFNRVVAVQYPRQGVYTIGFQTGEGVQTLNARVGRKMVPVFIPTSPTPLTGVVVMVPAEELIQLDMTVEEAFRFCITAGMLSRVDGRLPHGEEAGGKQDAAAGQEQTGSETALQPDPTAQS